MAKIDTGLTPDDLAVGDLKSCVVAETPILLVRAEQRIWAIANRCTHAGSPLDAGRLAGLVLRCPLHGIRFDISTGACVSAVRCAPLATFEVSEDAGRLLVSIPD